MDRWMNSGIQFRSHYDPHYRTGEVYGDQVEIEGSERRWTGGIFDQSRRGWWKGGLDDNKAGLEAYKPNQWNHMRLVVIGPYIKTWINGILTANIVDSKDTTGFIALQLHHAHNHGTRAVHEGAQIKFKNIQIKAKE